MSRLVRLSRVAFIVAYRSRTQQDAGPGTVGRMHPLARIGGNCSAGGRKGLDKLIVGGLPAITRRNDAALSHAGARTFRDGRASHGVWP